MSKTFTYKNADIEIVKSELGAPIQSFGHKEQWIQIYRKEVFGSLVVLALGGYLIYSVVSSISYLGRDAFIKMRLNFKNGFWRIVRLAILIGNISHLKNLFTSGAELYDKGFYLKNGSKEYVYTFKHIQHLQKVFLKGSNNTITTIILSLSLDTWENVKINLSGNEVMVHFADALSLRYAESKKSEVSENFKKGEKIWFWIVEIDKTHLYYDNKITPRSEISALKKARSDRFRIVQDHNNKKLAKLDRNKIQDEDLFKMLLEENGVKCI